MNSNIYDEILSSLQHTEVSEVYREKVYEFLAYIRVNFALRAFAG